MCKPPASHEGQHIDTCFNSLEIQSVICNNSGLHHHKAQWLALCKFYSMRVHKQTFLWTPLHTCTWRQCSFVKTFCRNSFCSLLCNGFDNLLDLCEAHGLRSTFLVGGTCLFLKLPGLPPLPLPAWQNTEVKG